MPTAPSTAATFPDAQVPGRRPQVAPEFVMAAAADLHEAGMLTESSIKEIEDVDTGTRTRTS